MLMNKFTRYTILVFMLSALVACVASRNIEQDSSVNTQPNSPNTYTADLNAIKEDGVLKAAVSYSSTSYFLYKGKPMGFEYELLQRLAKKLKLKLKVVVANDPEEQVRLLNSGEVDLIAHGLTITNEWKERVHFTEHLYITRQVLVQRKPANWAQISWSSLQKQIIHDPMDLLYDTVSVHKNSSYHTRLQNLSSEMGGNIIIDTLNQNLSADEVIKMVVDGKIKYTIADENIANIYASYYPNLKVDIPISFSQHIAWAVRKTSLHLGREINEWLLEERNSALYNVTYNKYFKNTQSFKKREASNLYSINNNAISIYDETIKKYAKTLNLDWRLIASQIYQESRFNPQIESETGAKGLMQIMPVTTIGLGINDASDPEQSIEAGTRYLKTLFERFNEIGDSITQMKFALASYNCGYYHVKDAQKLAVKNNLNPYQWEDNVENMLLELSNPENYRKSFIEYGYVRGEEPVRYVMQIFERYEHYKELINYGRKH